MFAAQSPDVQQRHERLTRLHERLIDRPNDRGTASKVAHLEYSLGLYQNAIASVLRSLELCRDSESDEDHLVHLRLARAYVRCWQREGKESLLHAALRAFQSALEFQQISSKAVHYLEVASIYRTLNEHQLMINTLATVLLRWPHSHEAAIAVEVCAHTLFARGQFSEALPYFKELIMDPPPVGLTGDFSSGTGDTTGDFPEVHFPLGRSCIPESSVLEMARCYEGLRDVGMARQAYNLAWTQLLDRQKREEAEARAAETRRAARTAAAVATAVAAAAAAAAQGKQAPEWEAEEEAGEGGARPEGEEDRGRPVGSSPRRLAADGDTPVACSPALSGRGAPRWTDGGGDITSARSEPARRSRGWGGADSGGDEAPVSQRPRSAPLPLIVPATSAGTPSAANAATGDLLPRIRESLRLPTLPRPRTPGASSGRAAAAAAAAATRPPYSATTSSGASGGRTDEPQGRTALVPSDSATPAQRHGGVAPERRLPEAPKLGPRLGAEASLHVAGQAEVRGQGGGTYRRGGGGSRPATALSEVSSGPSLGVRTGRGGDGAVTPGPPPLKEFGPWVEDPHTWFSYAETLLKGRCHIFALSFLDKALELLPGSLLEGLKAQGRSEDRSHSFEDQGPWPALDFSLITLHLHRAECLFELGRFKDAAGAAAEAMGYDQGNKLLERKCIKFMVLQDDQAKGQFVREAKAAMKIQEMARHFLARAHLTRMMQELRAANRIQRFFRDWLAMNRLLRLRLVVMGAMAMSGAKDATGMSKSNRDMVAKCMQGFTQAADVAQRVARRALARRTVARRKRSIARIQAFYRACTSRQALRELVQALVVPAPHKACPGGHGALVAGAVAVEPRPAWEEASTWPLPTQSLPACVRVGATVQRDLFEPGTTSGYGKANLAAFVMHPEEFQPAGPGGARGGAAAAATEGRGEAGQPDGAVFELSGLALASAAGGRGDGGSSPGRGCCCCSGGGDFSGTAQHVVASWQAPPLPPGRPVWVSPAVAPETALGQALSCPTLVITSPTFNAISARRLFSRIGQPCPRPDGPGPGGHCVPACLGPGPGPSCPGASGPAPPHGASPGVARAESTPAWADVGAGSPAAALEEQCGPVPGPDEIEIKGEGGGQGGSKPGQEAWSGGAATAAGGRRPLGEGLHTVIVMGTTMGDTGVRVLGQAVMSGRLPLVNLVVEGAATGTRGLAALAKALASPQSRIEKLALEGCCLGLRHRLDRSKRDAAWDRFFVHVQYCRTLRTLALRRCDLEDRDMQALSVALQANAGVRVLNLNGNRVSPRGLRALVLGLHSKRRRLEALWLRGQGPALPRPEAEAVLAEAFALGVFADVEFERQQAVAAGPPLPSPAGVMGADGGRAQALGGRGRVPRVERTAESEDLGRWAPIHETCIRSMYL